MTTYAWAVQAPTREDTLIAEFAGEITCPDPSHTNSVIARIVRLYGNPIAAGTFPRKHKLPV